MTFRSIVPRWNHPYLWKVFNPSRCWHVVASRIHILRDNLFIILHQDLIALGSTISQDVTALIFTMSVSVLPPPFTALSGLQKTKTKKTRPWLLENNIPTQESALPRCFQLKATKRSSLRLALWVRLLRTHTTGLTRPLLAQVLARDVRVAVLTIILSIG